MLSVLLFVLLLLVPWVKRGTGNGVRCRKRKTLKVIKDVNPDTQVKLKKQEQTMENLESQDQLLSLLCLDPIFSFVL